MRESQHNVLSFTWLNSLAPGRFERNLRKVIFKLISMICDWGIFCKIALRWMSMNLTDDKSTLVRVMAWCRQAASHYLSQCWPRSVSPYGVTRPRWVNCNGSFLMQITCKCLGLSRWAMSMKACSDSMVRASGSTCNTDCPATSMVLT